MKKQILTMVIGLMAAAGIFLGVGCFSSPTSPAITGAGNSDPNHPNAPTAVPTHPTGLIIPIPGVSTYSISGSINGSSGGEVTIMATSISGNYQAIRTGDGPYTINGVPSGSYTLYAFDSQGNTGNDTVVITNSSLTNINITIH
jgi:hypothetical protein